MKIKHIFYLVIGLLFVQACYDDKGNYDYKNVNEVTIKLPKSYFNNIIMGTPVLIEPTITFKNPEDTSYFKYEWYLAANLVSTERNLNTTWNELGETYGEFRVIDTLTGCKYMVNFSIGQVTPYETGWMVLYDKDGKSKLCYIQDQNGVYKDFIGIYEEINGEGLGSSPVKMVEHYTTKKASEILVIQRGAPGCVEVDGKSLMRKVTTQQEFLNETLPEQFAPVDASYAGRVNYILNGNGQVFSRQADPTALHTNRYSVLPLSDNGKELKIQALISVVESRAEFTVLCDATNKRLVGALTQSQANAGKLVNLYLENYPEGTIRLDNFGDHEMIYTGAYMEGQQSCEFVSIFKDLQNQYKLQAFVVNYIAVGGGLEIKNIDVPVVAGDGLFCDRSMYFLLKRRPYLFFTTGANGDQLYYLDLATNKTHLYKNFEGERVVSLCANKDCQNLGVALEGGKFFIFDIADQLLGREVKVLHSVENLGTVVHAIHKYGTLDNFAYN
jgi:hypothetical protein